MRDGVREVLRSGDEATTYSVEARAEEDGLLRFICPSCGRDIYDGFPRGVTTPFNHHITDSGSKSVCRLVIDTDPVGESHQIVVVDKGGRVDPHVRDLAYRPERRRKLHQLLTADYGELLQEVARAG